MEIKMIPWMMWKKRLQKDTHPLRTHWMKWICRFILMISNDHISFKKQVLVPDPHEIPAPHRSCLNVKQPWCLGVPPVEPRHVAKRETHFSCKRLHLPSYYVGHAASPSGSAPLEHIWSRPLFLLPDDLQWKLILLNISQNEQLSLFHLFAHQPFIKSWKSL